MGVVEFPMQVSRIGRHWHRLGCQDLGDGCASLVARCRQAVDRLPDDGRHGDVPTLGLDRQPTIARPVEQELDASIQDAHVHMLAHISVGDSGHLPATPIDPSGPATAAICD